MHRSLRICARPKDVNTEVGTNVQLPPDLFKKYKDIFGVSRDPHRKVIANYRYFMRPGKAMTGPPLGQDLSKVGVKAMDFCKAFNDKTKGVFKDDVELILRIQVYEDKTYSWRIEPPPGAWYILRCCRKKRRETDSSKWVCFVTLEMLFEIAKQKMRHWAFPEEPEIEIRVRFLIGQARAMGICVLGVDCPSSPVWGMTEREYEQKSEDYRKKHREQFFERQRQAMQKAPLYASVHSPNLSRLSAEEIQLGLRDPKLFRSLWHATHPKSVDSQRAQREEMAMRYLRSKNWAISKETPRDELISMYRNEMLPPNYVESQWNASHASKV